jgi:hypothetical protein
MYRYCNIAIWQPQKGAIAIILPERSMAWIHKLGHPLVAATGVWAVGSVAWAALHDPIETTPAADCANAGGARVLTPEAKRTLQQRGFVVVDAVLQPHQLVRARAQAAARFGDMTSTHENPTNVRTDHVVWIQQNRRQWNYRASSTDMRRGPDSATEPSDAGAAAQHKGGYADKVSSAVASGAAETGGDLDACVALLRGLASELDDCDDYTHTRGHSSPVQLQVSACDCVRGLI